MCSETFSLAHENKIEQKTLKGTSEKLQADSRSNLSAGI